MIDDGIHEIVCSGWMFPHLVFVNGFGVGVTGLYRMISRVYTYILMSDLIHVGLPCSLLSLFGHLRSCRNWEI